MSKLTHLNSEGAAHMVDVGDKPDTERAATAQAVVSLSADTLALIVSGEAPKGDVLAAARIAGIMAAKRTSDLIPLCHPIALTGVEVRLRPELEKSCIVIEAQIRTRGPTGVEMEALTAVTVSALTLYDMIKSVERTAIIGDIRLLEKRGGRSGHFVAAQSLPSRQTRARPRAAAAVARPTNETRREAFRRFMIENRLRVQSWAKAAGISSATVFSYLHGRVPRLTEAQEIALARAASTTVPGLFGG